MEYLRFVWHGVAADEPQETWLELDAELAGHWEDVAFEVYSLSAAEFAIAWAWALSEARQGRY